MRINNKEVENKDGKNMLDEVLKTLGAYEDIASISKNVSGMGGGLLVDAAQMIAGAAAKEKDGKEDKTAPLISHPKWEEFAACFDSEDQFIEGSNE